MRPMRLASELESLEIPGGHRRAKESIRLHVRRHDIADRLLSGPIEGMGERGILRAAFVGINAELDHHQSV